MCHAAQPKRKKLLICKVYILPPLLRNFLSLASDLETSASSLMVHIVYIVYLLVIFSFFSPPLDCQLRGDFALFMSISPSSLKHEWHILSVLQWQISYTKRQKGNLIIQLLLCAREGESRSRLFN